MKKILITAAFALAVFWSVDTAFAATVVTGDLSGNIQWNENSGPYLIQGTVTLTDRARLNISSGAVIKFSPQARLIIKGELDAKGSKNKPVFFTSAFDDSIGGDTNEDGAATTPSSTDDWQIVFNNTRDADIEYVQIKYSSLPIYYDSKRKLSIEDTTVSNLQRFLQQQNGSVSMRDINITSIDQGLFFTFGESRLEISKGKIEGVGSIGLIFDSSRFSMNDIVASNLSSGIFNAYTSSDVELKATTFKGVQGGAGIQLYGKSDLRVTDSVIQEVAGAALSVYEESDYRIKSTLFSDGDIGIRLYGSKKSTGDIDKVTIQNFTTAGIQSFDGGDIKIHQGTIVRNGVGIMSFRENKINLSNNTVAYNTIAGIQNFGTGQVKAEKVFWGDSSGPLHPTLNPKGKGNLVSDNVDFTPWARSADGGWDRPDNWHKKENGCWGRR